MSKTTSVRPKLARENRSDSEENGPKREGWTADDLGEQSSYEGTSEISRRLRRGDETAGDPDERDVAGAIPIEDTPHGREIRRIPRKPTEKSDQKPS
jgi:hypothetical protein